LKPISGPSLERVSLTLFGLGGCIIMSRCRWPLDILQLESRSRTHVASSKVDSKLTVFINILKASHNKKKIRKTKRKTEAVHAPRMNFNMQFLWLLRRGDGICAGLGRFYDRWTLLSRGRFKSPFTVAFCLLIKTLTGLRSLFTVSFN